jgi:hypothetical protein
VVVARIGNHVDGDAQAAVVGHGARRRSGVVVPLAGRSGEYDDRARASLEDETIHVVARSGQLAASL